MKVIFIQDVTNAGKAGEVKEVTNGYGRNYLIPKNLAVIAKADSINTIAAKIKVHARHRAESEAEMTKLGGKLEGQEITIEARSGGKERLYGSITTADIAEKLEETTGLAIDKRKIEIEGSIRQIGSYEVTIRLTKDIMPKIKVTVTEKSS